MTGVDIIMSDFSRCFGCMREITEKNPCPYCGYYENNPPESTLHMEPGILLSDRYVIGRVLGQGGFGITYIGWDSTLNLTVAIKEYLPLSMATRNTGSVTVSCASKENKEDYDYGLNKFLDEARILALFGDMPNIVGARDFFRANGTAYMVMEYIDGINLKQYIDKHNGKIPWDQAASVIMFVGDALKEVHSKGLLHRDVSPDNIFITSKNQVKLLDFGAARAALGMQNKSISIMLKHGYAPFEQYSSRGNQGPWTDVYSLSATTYRCITGELPPEALERLEDDKLVPPSQKGIKLPMNVESAIMKGLAIRPQDRYQTVAEFQAALSGTEYIPSNSDLWTPSPETSKEEKTVIYPHSENNKTFQTAVTPSDNIPYKFEKKHRKILALSLVSIIAVFLAIGLLVYPKIAQSSPEELFSEAQDLIKNKDAAKGFEKMTLSANAGYAPAQLGLAEMYLTGTAGDQNATKAAGILLPLASSGNPEALYRLGKLYLNGVGVNKDNNAGIQYISEAADKGMTNAAYELGHMYEEGITTNKNYAKAIEFYSKALGYKDSDARKSAIIEKQRVEQEQTIKAAEEKRVKEEQRRIAEQKRKATEEEKRKQQAEKQKVTVKAKTEQALTSGPTVQENTERNNTLAQKVAERKKQQAEEDRLKQEETERVAREAAAKKQKEAQNTQDTINVIKTIINVIN